MANTEQRLAEANVTQKRLAERNTFFLVSSGDIKTTHKYK